MHAHMQIVVLFGWVLTLGVCFMAWRLGGRAERQAALLVIVTSVLTVLPALFLDKSSAKLGYLALDGTLALGLLLLALRYAAAWLGAAVLLQAVQFSLHAYYLVIDKRYDNIYVMVNNLVSLGVLCSLALGTFLAWRARRSAAK